MNFMSMAYFLAVSETKNITRAAEQLHITQQTLSAHIKSIETELACQLFIRSNPLQLTYAGEIYLRHANDIIEGYQAMWNEFNDLTNNQRGKILIGINYVRSLSLMPPIICEFHKHYPNIEVRLTEGANKELQQQLINKELDLVIARFAKPVLGVDIIDFFSEEIMLLVPKKFFSKKLNLEEPIDNINDFQNFPFLLGNPTDITGQIGRELIRKSGFEPIIRCQSNNLETLLALCSRGLGMCFAPSSAIHSILTKDQRNNLCIFRLPPNYSYPIRFAYRKTSYQWKIILEFVRIAKSIFSQKNIPSVLEAQNTT
uniref:LysR family transcriptional regulator n=1 Tax=Ndongobacter massiliensis TaxID=1871025 RepID=UPI0009306E68|nr:LysR family transcriptional regulator [Ndongobacter massiliensis]